MRAVWTQRREELLSDCLVSPDVFTLMVDRLYDFVVPYQRCLVNILPGMNAGASTYTVPSPIEGSGTAWVLLGSWALSPARPTPIHPRHECRGFSAFFGEREVMKRRCPKSEVMSGE